MPQAPFRAIPRPPSSRRNSGPTTIIVRHTSPEEEYVSPGYDLSSGDEATYTMGPLSTIANLSSDRARAYTPDVEADLSARVAPVPPALGTMEESQAYQQELRDLNLRITRAQTRAAEYATERQAPTQRQLEYWWESPETGRPIAPPTPIVRAVGPGLPEHYGGIKYAYPPY